MALARALLGALWALNLSLCFPLPSGRPGERGPPGSPGHVGSLGPLLSPPPARRVGMGRETEGIWKPSGISSSPAALVIPSAVQPRCLLPSRRSWYMCCNTVGITPLPEVLGTPCCSKTRALPPVAILPPAFSAACLSHALGLGAAR